MAWSPLGGGALFRDHTPQGERVAAVLRRIAGEIGCPDPGCVALAWLMRHPTGPIPVLGTGRIERLRSLAMACAISLEREQWFEVLEASTGQPVP